MYICKIYSLNKIDALQKDKFAIKSRGWNLCVSPMAVSLRVKTFKKLFQSFDHNTHMLCGVALSSAYRLNLYYWIQLREEMTVSFSIYKTYISTYVYVFVYSVQVTVFGLGAH